MIRIRRITPHTYALSDTHFNETLRDICRRVPGMRWHGDVREWRGYADAVAVAVDLLHELNDPDIVLSGPKPVPIPPSTPSGLMMAFSNLRSYQKEGVAFLVHNAEAGAILADDLGLGKSAQSLRAARALKQSTLIVCPAHVRGVWGDGPTSEVKKWWPEAWPPQMLSGTQGGAYFVKLRGNEEALTKSHGGVWLCAEQERLGFTSTCAKCLKLADVTVKTKSPSKLCAEHQKMWGERPWAAKAWSPKASFAFPSLAAAEACVALLWPKETKTNIAKLVEYVPANLYEEGQVPLLTVCHYDILHAWAPHLAGQVRTLILDEVHYCANDSARRTKACRHVARAAVNRIGLSGTPMTNVPKNLWSVVDTLAEARFGENPWYGIEWGNGFFGRYCDAHKEEVPDPKNGPTAKKVVWKFDGASNTPELNFRLRFLMKRRTKADVQIELPPRTRQIIEIEVPKRFMGSSSSVSSLISNGAVNKAALRKQLDLAADGKLPDVIELVREHVESGSKVVVYCHRQAVSEHISNSLVESGVDSAFIHGGVPQKKRDIIIAKQPQVLCAGIDVTSSGIDLTYASVGVFAELSYQAYKVLQCEGRQHRFGAKSSVLFQYPCARGTADELVRKICLSKLEVFEKTIGKTDSGLREDFGVESGQSEEEREEDALRDLYQALLKQSKEETDAL